MSQRKKESGIKEGRKERERKKKKKKALIL